jgi:hypothetical protein
MDPKFFRKYLDILNEAAEPGQGEGHSLITDPQQFVKELCADIANTQWSGGFRWGSDNYDFAEFLQDNYGEYDPAEGNAEQYSDYSPAGNTFYTSFKNFDTPTQIKIMKAVKSWSKTGSSDEYERWPSR